MTHATEQVAVFLSYAASDEGIAQAVRYALSHAGLHVQLASELPDGGDFQKAIRQAMKSCDAYLLIASPDSSASPWTAFEVGAAMGWGKAVFAIAATADAPPAYLRPFRTFKVDQLPQLIRLLQREAEPLTEPEREILREVYSEFGTTVDQLLRDPDAANRLVVEFNRRSRAEASSNRLLREMSRLGNKSRRQGIRAPRANAVH